MWDAMMKSFKGKALPYLALAIVLLGCSTPVESKYQSMFEQNARGIIARGRGLVWVADYLPEYKYETSSEKVDEFLIGWRPKNSPETGLITQISHRYPTASQAAYAFPAESAHLTMPVFYVPEWSVGLDLKAAQHVFRCERDPKGAPASPTLIHCEYMAQYDVWIHTTYIELDGVSTVVAAIPGLITATDRSLVR